MRGCVGVDVWMCEFVCVDVCMCEFVCAWMVGMDVWVWMCVWVHIYTGMECIALVF